MLQKEDRRWVENTIAKVRAKMAWLSEKSSDKIPYITIDKDHDNMRNGGLNGSDGLLWWTNGFWAGMLWLMYHETGEKTYANIARKTEEWLDDCFNRVSGLHHDVGFMWLTSAVAGYSLTGNPNSRERGIHAAQLLASRFNPVGRFIRAWNDLADGKDTRGWAIIDSMLNIPLLYWASEETSDPRFKQIAMMHADTIRENFIRVDGSCEHIVEFNPESGKKVSTHVGQGYADGSAWTRGQAWALYGFMISYLCTDERKYLDTARCVGGYFMDHIPESGLIPVDFQQPAQPALEDSSAAAIAACGFIELARNGEAAERDSCLQVALKILKALDKRRCDYSRERDNILTHCTRAYHHEHRHVGLVYADYYYMEALSKLKGLDLQR